MGISILIFFTVRLLLSILYPEVSGTWPSFKQYVEKIRMKGAPLVARYGLNWFGGLCGYPAPGNWSLGRDHTQLAAWYELGNVPSRNITRSYRRQQHTCTVGTGDSSRNESVCLKMMSIIVYRAADRRILHQTGMSGVRR
jgi:hypothetical protein